MAGIGVGLVRMVLNGTLGTVQTWSTSVWLDLGFPIPDPTQDGLNSYAADCRDAIQPAVVTFATQLWSAAVKCTDVTAYWYDPNTTKAAFVSQPAPIVTAGSGGTSLPFYCSLVLSLRSLTPGRSGRGRNYLPVTSPSLTDGQGQLGQGTIDAVCTAWADALSALNAMPVTSISPNGQRVVVASFTKGRPFPVTSVVVDSIPDTQHRRTDQLAAEHTATDAVSP